MGSLRNPVGPLPSSIYWRRRVVLVSMVALLALLGTWIVASGGGGTKKYAGGSNGKNPASTITPGPSSSGPAISEHPGGRDESGGGGADGGGSGDGSGSTSGPGSDGTGASGAAGSGDGSGSDGSGSGSGSSPGTGSGNVGSGDVLPASASLPDCAPGAVALGLRSVHNSYSPDQTPAFELTVKNTGSSDCKVDLGPKHAVLTVTPADSDDEYWSSADCPKGAAGLEFRVAAGQSITYTVKWDRKPSAPDCTKQPTGSAKSGTYLLEAQASGFPKAQTSFVLSAD